MRADIEALLSPADYQACGADGFRGQVCVVFDVLRATSVIVTGLANGAAGFIPAGEINEALALRLKYPRALLAGERNGLRITAAQGGVEFEFGNSPREFTQSRVEGHTIISTTTNGTRAIRACAPAEVVMAASFLNLEATARWLTASDTRSFALVCAGTGEFTALEDVLAAGALVDLLVRRDCEVALSDSAELALGAYHYAGENLLSAAQRGRNGRRLLENPSLREDVEFCLRRDVVDLVAILGSDGVIRQTKPGK